MRKYLISVGLPESLEENTDKIVSELPVWTLVQKIAHREDIRNFSVMAGSSMGFDDFVLLDGMNEGCLNLHDLLKRFCVDANLYSSNNCYELEYDEHSVSLVQKNRRLLENDVQIELFEVLGFMQLVQICTGKQWRPNAISFTFSEQTEINHASEFNPARVYYSQRFPSISFSRETLSLLLPKRWESRNVDLNYSGNPLNHRSMPNRIDEQLREIVIPYLTDSGFGINQMDELVGFSRRTLQRRLADMQKSYSEVIEQARMQKAADLLTFTDMKMIDINFMLGYENPSSFTRAFVRWAGISPKQFRKIHLSDLN